MTAIDQRVRRRHLADDAEHGRSAAAEQLCQASTWCSVFSRRQAARRFFAATRSRVPLSTERYRISVKIEPKGRLELTCAIMSAWAMLSTSARRAEASFCSRERGRWCCSAPGSERRRCSRCCTRWPRPTRHGRSCGCTQLAMGSIIHSAPKSAVSCARSPHGRDLCVLQQARSRDKMGEDFDATGHLSRSVFDAVGVSREADVYLCGPTRLHDRHERGARDLWRCAGADSRRDLQRQRVDDAGRRRRDDASAAFAQGRRRAPVRWYRSRAAASPRTGMAQPTRAFWSWPRRATSRSVGRAARVCVTPARVGWFRGMSPTDRSRSKSRPTATCWCAAHNPSRDVVIDL